MAAANAAPESVCPRCRGELVSLEIVADGPGVLIDECECTSGHEVERVFELTEVRVAADG